LIPTKITREDNEYLTRPIGKEEIRQALFHMHADKAPGPDGFNPAFFQQYWDVCGDDIWRAAGVWLERGFFPSNLNDTNICLIPKCENPVSLKDMRPIALCNVLYKMVSKVLANRLRVHLDKLISPEQSAFVEGRSIIDNALVAIEIIHAMKRKTRGNNGHLALKIDISKAYDRVDWGFLRGMLERMGFDEVWVRWMMMCVSTVNYSVLLNFEKLGPIVPGRGLRQGDPLSPYLFILVAEGLTALMKQAVGTGTIHGMRICRGAPVVSHLLFADDCFLFCRASVAEATQLLTILRTYADASGQQINLSKSEVFISRNLSVAAQEDLASVLGVTHVLGTGTYLGLPSMIGRSKKAIFSFIKDRIWKKINSWRGRALSKAGKEVMIKSVLQAIPSYIMSVYMIPSTIVSEIERLINGFWWGGGEDRKGIRWMAWDRLTCPKQLGGMGFRDFLAFNKAMLAKQGWRIMQNPDSMVAKIFKARYFPNSTFLDANLGHNPSFTWRGLWGAREVLLKGCRWVIGDGRKIRVMGDPWIREEGERWMRSPQQAEVYSLHVSDLMLDGRNEWDRRKVEDLFMREEAGKILSIPLFDSNREDKLVWDGDKDGIYSVRMGYRSLMKETWERVANREGKCWERLWRINAPPKCIHLLWRICRGCIPTRSRLIQRHVNCSISCPLCNSGMEDDFHAFFTCANITDCWTVAGLSHIIHNRLTLFDNVVDLIFYMCSHEHADMAGRFAVLMWHIWQNRNDMVWNSHSNTASTVGQQAITAWQAWNTANQQLHHRQMQQTRVQQNRVDSSVTWTKPPLGWLKCNVDAGFSFADGVTTTASCFRDGNGSLICAQTQRYQAKMSTLEGESLALLDAVLLAHRKGFNYVIFESDSQTLVNAITSPNNRHGNSEFCNIIARIRNSLASLSNFEVKFTRRQANMAAHSLSRAAISWSCHRFFEYVPPCIATLIFNESC
jgi:ribonuclease HI